MRREPVGKRKRKKPPAGDGKSGTGCILGCPAEPGRALTTSSIF